MNTVLLVIAGLLCIQCIQQTTRTDSIVPGVPQIFYSKVAIQRQAHGIAEAMKTIIPIVLAQLQICHQ